MCTYLNFSLNALYVNSSLHLPQCSDQLLETKSQPEKQHIIWGKISTYTTPELKTTIQNKNQPNKQNTQYWLKMKAFPGNLKSELSSWFPTQTLGKLFTYSPSHLFSCFEVCKMASVSNQSRVPFQTGGLLLSREATLVFASGLQCDSSSKARGCLFWSFYVQSLFTVIIFFLSPSPSPLLVTYRNGHAHLTNGTCIGSGRASEHDWMRFQLQPRSECWCLQLWW